MAKVKRMRLHPAMLVPAGLMFLISLLHISYNYVTPLRVMVLGTNTSLHTNTSLSNNDPQRTGTKILSGLVVDPLLSNDGVVLNHPATDPCQNGTSRCVISVALYGQHDRYIRGFYTALDGMKKWYPGWTMRVYYHDIPEAVLNDTLPEVEFVESFKAFQWTILYMCLRFLIAWDNDVDVFLIRDSDSRFSDRERAVVLDWLASGKDFHVIRDADGHCIPIMGGMWGGRGGALPEDALKSLQDLFEQDTFQATPYGMDQTFLTRHVWQHMQGRVVSHDSFCCSNFPEGFRPFLTRSHTYEEGPPQYIGQPTYYKNGTELDPFTVPEHREKWFKLECPQQCRPVDHMDWHRC